MSKIATATAALLMLAGCAQSPAERVDSLERERANEREASGHNECQRRVDANDARFEQCLRAKLATAGYTDAVDCLIDYQNSICTDKRYSAQVHANNACITELGTDTWPTRIDCMQLLQQ